MGHIIETVTKVVKLIVLICCVTSAEICVVQVVYVNGQDVG